MPNDFAYSPEQAELQPRQVRDELPAGHGCFLIPEVIAGLELSHLDPAYGEEGPKAYDPRRMLQVWQYGFAVKVGSRRKLEQGIREDLGFGFLAGGVRPEHKTLSELVRRHGTALEELLTQGLGWARRAGMVKWGRVAIDATRIKAQASPDRLQGSDERQVRQGRPRMEPEDPDPDPGLQVEANPGQRLRQEVGRGESTAGAKKWSLTDPEAGFLRLRGGKFCWGYSGELAVREDHFMVAVPMTQQAADNACLLPMVQEVERHGGGQPQQVLADSGFYSGDNLDVLEEKGIAG